MQLMRGLIRDGFVIFNLWSSPSHSSSVLLSLSPFPNYLLTPESVSHQSRQQANELSGGERGEGKEEREEGGGREGLKSQPHALFRAWRRQHVDVAAAAQVGAESE